MATFKTVQMTNEGNFVKNDSYAKGVTKAYFGEYTTLGTETTDDLLNIASLPQGSTVMGISECNHGAMGGALTFAAGDGDDNNRYKTATSVVSAGKFAFDTIGGRGYVIGTADDDELLSLLIEGGTVAASQKIYTCVLYVV